MYKRNWIKRAFRTGGQSALAAAAAAGLSALQGGDFTTNAIYGALVAALSAFASAVQNAYENRKRLGPVEED